MRQFQADELLGWEAPGEAIKAKLVEHRHGATRNLVIVANVLVAGVVVAMMWGGKSPALLLGWLAAISGIALLLGWSMRDYAQRSSAHSPQHWALRFTFGALINGVGWGLGALLLFDPATPDLNILMVGVICGMTAGNVVTSFAIPSSVYAYLAPAILLSMVMPLSQGSSVEHTLALLWLPYLVIMVVLTRSAHQALAQSLRLSYENARLAESLTVAKERAEKLAQAKADFLAVMSHEIRTPMHGMLGVAELLSATDLAPKQKNYLAHLKGAGEYLSLLLNNILDFSKIEAEKLLLNEEAFSLPALVGEVVGLFEMQAAQKGLVLHASLPADMAPTWCGDAHRLKQVLINLVGNAVKFTDGGTITLEVSLARREHGRSAITFRVGDRGPGISPELLTTIFDPFVQESPSVPRQFGGTGLGLAISQRLVAAMGGELTVVSEIGQGSVFSFSLRLAPVEQPAAPAVAEPAPAYATTLFTARVLLADDSPLNRLVVREFLAETACIIEEAENGAEAVQMFQEGRYDVVLMDMRMPVIDGVEAAARIRRWEAEQQRAPALIIMLTASVFDSDRAAVMAAGCNEILTKPVHKEALVNLLCQRLNSENTLQE